MTAGVPPRKIDVHLHLAGIGTDGSGCWISPLFQRRLTFRLLRLVQRIKGGRRDPTDADWAANAAALVRDSELDQAVALGFDGVYDARGELDRALSQMIIPSAWVFEVCRRHPELLPGPSVNPHRRDALERLEECIDGGAALIKWLPATQRIDAADPAILPFLRRVAEAGIPLLVHSGGSEGTFAEIDPSLKDLERLRPALRLGVRVIVAHSGVPVIYMRDPDQLPLLREMLAEHPHLWVDNSGMSNPSRFRHLPRMAGDPDIAPRTLHGSDYPVPTNAFWYARVLGARRAWRLDRIRNPLQRDVELKRALGYPDDALTRHAAALAHLDRWPAPVKAAPHPGSAIAAGVQAPPPGTPGIPGEPRASTSGTSGIGEEPQGPPQGLPGIRGEWPASPQGLPGE
ncbi:MAG TPA: amidohydrolase family protein [Longimicrobium sp.]|nr:amidohydrolase family protein [Longimicrobium sp.]